MHEIFGMQMQMEYGMHFISVSGRYLCYRENFIEGEGQEHCYFSFHHEERFKNTGLHLSCLSVGTELNKIVFGTIRGLIIIYDVFSHQFRVRSSHSEPQSVKQRSGAGASRRQPGLPAHR